MNTLTIMMNIFKRQLCVMLMKFIRKTTEVVIVSRYIFERLPDEYKKVIEKAAQTIIAQERQQYSTNDIEFLENLKDEGVEVTSPEKEPFRKASRKVYQTWADKIGGMDLIQKILDFDYPKEKSDGSVWDSGK